MRNVIGLALLILGLNVTGCKNSKEENLNLVNRYNGTIVFFSDSLYLINKSDNMLVLDTLLGRQNESFKIVNIINGECGKCMSYLKEWKRIIDKYKTINIKFIFIVNTSDTAYFNKFIYPEINLQIPFYIDMEKKFVKTNNLDYPDDRIKTFLLDKNNKIIFMGNPTWSREIELLYDKVISF
jgi:hypothetical protein